MTAHAAGLALVLLVLLAFVGTSTSYSADEGAAIIQARSLADGDGWAIPHPIPEVDPNGDHYPLELSESGPKGVASYAKHPAYPVLLAGADRLGGHTAMVLLSVLGTWGAALGAAFLARALTGGFARSALWLVGAGSPLLFDAYWVIAHSLAAALVVWALHLALHLGRSPRPLLVGAAVPVLIGLATMVRTEVALYAVGLGLALGALAVLERSGAMFGAAVAMGVSSLAARALDAWWLERIVGSPVSSTGSFAPRASGGVGQRWDGFVATWLRAGPEGEDGLAVAAVVLAAVLVLAAGVALWRGRSDLAVTFAVMAATAAAVRALALPAEPIPALLVAFPILAFAVVALASERRPFDRRKWIVAGGLAVSWAGVLATQYAEGGVAEWGGRYFAVGLPIVAPLALLLAAGSLQRATDAQATGLRWALGLTLAALSVASIRELRDGHQQTERTLDRVARLASVAGPDPVIVTDSSAIPRLDWAAFDEHRWLLLDPATDPGLPGRLAGQGVERWVLVSPDVDDALDAFDDVEVVEEASPNIVLVEHRR